MLAAAPMRSTTAHLTVFPAHRTYYLCSKPLNHDLCRASLGECLRNAAVIRNLSNRLVVHSMRFIILVLILFDRFVSFGGSKQVRFRRALFPLQLTEG